MKPLRVLAMAHDPTASISQIRLARPLGLLVEQGLIELRLRGFHQRRLADGDWADLVVLQRASGPEHLRWLQLWQARGVPVVYEIDDLLIDPAPHLAQHDVLQRAQGGLRALLAAADLITASTAPLAEALAGFGPPVHTVPNGSPGYHGPLARHDQQQPISLIVASSDRQQLGALGEALAQLLGPTRAPAAPGQAVQLWGVGPVAAALTARGLPLQVLPLLPMERFLPTLAALPNPVGLLPLDGSAFSRCKSAVKFFDYAMAGIPCACADRPPYQAVVQPGLTGWLCADTPQAWLAALRPLVGHADRRREVALAARDDVLAHHSTTQMAQAWLAALQRARTLRTPQARSWLRRVGSTTADLLMAPLRGLRDANRRRLRGRQFKP
jgi:hypothetical protein